MVSFCGGSHQHWDDFKEALLMRFCSEQEGTLYHKFLAMKQETMVEDFLEKYETLGSPLRNLPNAVMEVAIMNGLKPKVLVEVRMMKPTNLAQMIEACQLVEERNKVLYLG